MEDTYLTPEEIARRLRVTDQTIYNLLRGGQLRGIRVGRLWRVTAGDLQSYLAASANDAAWREELDALLERVQRRVPADVSDAQIERDAIAAVHEAREMIRARGR
jgi:excisionase family DNA binding protein